MVSNNHEPRSRMPCLHSSTKLNVYIVKYARLAACWAAESGERARPQGYPVSYAARNSNEPKSTWVGQCQDNPQPSLDSEVTVYQVHTTTQYFVKLALSAKVALFLRVCQGVVTPCTFPAERTQKTPLWYQYRSRKKSMAVAVRG